MGGETRPRNGEPGAGQHLPGAIEQMEVTLHDADDCSVPIEDARNGCTSGACNARFAVEWGGSPEKVFTAPGARLSR